MLPSVAVGETSDSGRRRGLLDGANYPRWAVALTPASWRVFRRRYLIALPSALVVMVAGMVGLNFKVNESLSGADTVVVRLPDGPAEGGNYLIIGSDSREFVADEGAAQAFGTSEETGPKKSDTMMVLHVDPTTKTSLLVSFPRDLLVEIPGQGTGQINAAFNDGPQKVVETLKANFDVDVNHYVEVDFRAFISVVDAVGKIPVYFDYPARDEYSGLSIGFAGCTDLDGNGALAYVRSRHLEYLKNGQWLNASPRADLDRIGRQQDFIRKLASKASARAGTNPFTAIEIADAVIAKLTIDTELSRDDILRLVKVFRNVDPEQPGALEMVTLPIEESSSQPGRLVAKQPEADALLTRLRTFGDGASAAPAVAHPTDVVVQVLNGSDLIGEAGKALAAFQERAFGPGGVGNATTTPTTQIRYGTNDRAKAELVARFLGGVGNLVEDPTLTDVDVTVIIGADWRGVHGKDKQVKAPATAPTTKAKDSKSGTGSAAQPGEPGVPTC